jgi:hypothetical protein
MKLPHIPKRSIEIQVSHGDLSVQPYYSVPRYVAYGLHFWLMADRKFRKVWSLHKHYTSRWVWECW